MIKKWKLEMPNMPSTFQNGKHLQDVVKNALAEEEEIRHFCFSDDTLEGVDGQTVEFVGCMFERCAFNECDIDRFSFVDCIFEKCEWTNARLSGFACQRVQFCHCRMTGLEWSHSIMLNTILEDCSLDYASFSETKLDRVMFAECKMRNSLWADMKLGRVRFALSDLSKAQWIRTPLAGIDMRTCVIEEWNISLFDLKGMKVTAAQVIGLSNLLGVEIV